MSRLVHLNVSLICCRSFRSEIIRLLLALHLLFSNLILPDYQNVTSFGLFCTSHFRKCLIEPAGMVFLAHTHHWSLQYSEFFALGFTISGFCKDVFVYNIHLYSKNLENFLPANCVS